MDQPDLLEANSLTSPQNRLLQSLTAKSRTEKNKKIQELVRQCFDILNTYARDAASISNAIKAFCLVLEGYEIKQITEAFLEWTKTNSAMPTPADISKLCLEISQRQAEKKSFAPTGRKTIIQKILDWETGEVLKTNGPSERMSPMQIHSIFSGRRVYERFSLE